MGDAFLYYTERPYFWERATNPPDYRIGFGFDPYFLSEHPPKIVITVTVGFIVGLWLHRRSDPYLPSLPGDTTNWTYFQTASGLIFPPSDPESGSPCPTRRSRSGPVAPHLPGGPPVLGADESPLLLHDVRPVPSRPRLGLPRAA